MIGKITGRIDYIAEDHVLIEAAGIGYIVHCSAATLRGLPEAGEMAALYTEMVVREDLMQLFGFRTLGEREWHRLLTSVQGVGAKVSLAILGTLGLNGISRALASGDAAAVKQAQGVGPKLALRIVTELKGKAPAMMALGSRGTQAAMPVQGTDPVGASPRPAPAAPMAASGPSPEDLEIAASADALSALVNLGYDRSDAAEAVAEAMQGGVETPEGLIKAALQSLGRNL